MKIRPNMLFLDPSCLRPVESFRGCHTHTAIHSTTYSGFWNRRVHTPVATAQFGSYILHLTHIYRAHRVTYANAPHISPRSHRDIIDYEFIHHYLGRNSIVATKYPGGKVDV